MRLLLHTSYLKSRTSAAKPLFFSIIYRTAAQAAEKLGFVSGHDFSRAVKDWEYVGL
jgi:hypothetical protein